MRKISLLILSLLTAMNIRAAGTINSIDIDGVTFYYIVDSDGKAEITNETGSYGTTNGYPGITSIVIPSEITVENGETYEVVSIGSYAFYHCESLTSVVIPEGVTTINEGAFDYCISLTSVLIPDGVTSIGSNAFSYCELLTYVVIPESVTSILSYAFRNCTSLTAVYFKGESQPKIGTNVFYQDSNVYYYVPYGCEENYTSSFSPLAVFYFDDDFFYDLNDDDKTATIYFTTIPYTATSMTIPDTFTVGENTYSVASIESGLFANFTSLTEVFVNWTEPIDIDDEGLFPEEIKQFATLYVPEGTVDAYSESNWAEYFGNIGVYVEEEEQGGDGEGGEGGDGEGGGTTDDDDNQDLEDSTNYAVVDGIKYEIIDDDLVQIVGATAENIVFVTKVEIEETTYDVESIATDAFVDYTNLSASVKFIDPEKIVVEGDNYSVKVGSLTVPDGCVDMYNRSDWTKIFTISGNDYLLSDDVYYIFKSSGLKSSAASKKITLEVDHINEKATYVTIPEDIYLDDYGYFNVTSINSTAFYNCNAIETLTIEADIPTTDAEALTTLPDNCILIVADVYKGKYDELLASTNITIITKSESVTNIKNVATEKVEVARYNILGQQLSAPFPGINLIKYSDGTVEKVILK